MNSDGPGLAGSLPPSQLQTLSAEPAVSVNPQYRESTDPFWEQLTICSSGNSLIHCSLHSPGEEIIEVKADV